MASSILIVEDDKGVSRFIKKGLSEEGFGVDSVFDGFSIYPNPINNLLNLKAAQNIDALEVYNLLGQNVLASKPNASQLQMDMSTLPTGLYVMKATIGNQTVTYKIVKE